MFIITKKNCQRCDHLKARLAREGLAVEFRDYEEMLSTVDGLVLMCDNEIFDRSLPVLIAPGEAPIQYEKNIMEYLRRTNGI